MTMRRLIAVGTRPPHGQLTIVAHPDYGSLALLPGERVEIVVEAAEAVLDEVDRQPGLGEPESWTEEFREELC